MTTSLPNADNVVSPVLLSATETTPAGAEGDTRITLDFNTAMTAGSGAIYVTDGAIETVIDRVTGLPTMRVVGATDTHVLSASELTVTGSRVELDVAGLLPGHGYSVLMGGGVLLSSGHLAFGGVRGASQIAFSTPSVADAAVPSVASAGIDGSVLKAGGSLGVTIVFSEAIKNLDADALTAPNAGITDISTSDGGLTWHATLQAPADAVTAASNLLTLDLGKVQDLAGHAGSGSFAGPAYDVDTQAPALAQFQLDGGLVAAHQAVGVTLSFSEKVTLTADAFDAPDAAVTNLASSDGGLTWSATLSNANPAVTIANQLTLDMGKVHDLAGNPGAGSVHAAQSYDVDTTGPTATIALDRGDLEAGGSIGVTITLSEQLDDLPLAALDAPNATLQGLHTTGGLTWRATLVPNAGVVSATNAVSLDLSQLHDGHGISGAGVASSPNYTVDTTVASYVNHQIDIVDQNGANRADHVSNDPDQVLSGTLSGDLLDGQHVALSIDGQAASAATDGLAWFYGGDGVHFDDGVHSVTAQVVDGAGHASAAFTQQFTIDTTAPSVIASALVSKGGDTWLDLSFSEAVVFVANGEIDVLDALGNVVSQHTWDVQTNWDIANDSHGVPSVLELKLGAAGSGYHLQVLGDAIQDLAGNVAIIGSSMPAP